MNIDYHVAIHHHYYSIPHELVHGVVEVRVSATTIEALHRGQHVAAHPRDDTRGRHTTDPADMPKAHRHHLEWTPSRLIRWAETIGPQTAALAAAILADRPHPEQGYRSCLGLPRLSRRDGAARLEAARGRALATGARSYRHGPQDLRPVFQGRRHGRNVFAPAAPSTAVGLDQASDMVTQTDS